MSVGPGDEGVRADQCRPEQDDRRRDDDQARKLPGDHRPPGQGNQQQDDSEPHLEDPGDQPQNGPAVFGLVTEQPHQGRDHHQQTERHQSAASDRQQATFACSGTG